MRAHLIAAIIALLAPAAASAAVERSVVLDIDENGPVEADLDQDGTVERISTIAHPRTSYLRRPILEHPCTGGGSRTRVLGPYQERNSIETLRARGSAAPPLLAVFASSGATGRLQTTWVHRLGPERDTDGCARLRTVFRFPHRSQPTPRPPRGTAPGAFSAAAREVDGRIWFRTTEGLYRRTDAGCCPTYVRTIDWKPRAGRYSRAKTRLRRMLRP